MLDQALPEIRDLLKGLLGVVEKVIDQNSPKKTVEKKPQISVKQTPEVKPEGRIRFWTDERNAELWRMYAVEHRDPKIIASHFDKTVQQIYNALTPLRKQNGLTEPIKKNSEIPKTIEIKAIDKTKYIGDFDPLTRVDLYYFLVRHAVKINMDESEAITDDEGEITDSQLVGMVNCMRSGQGKKPVILIRG